MHAELPVGLRHHWCGTFLYLLTSTNARALHRARKIYIICLLCHYAALNQCFNQTTFVDLKLFDIVNCLLVYSVSEGSVQQIHVITLTLPIGGQS